MKTSLLPISRAVRASYPATPAILRHPRDPKAYAALLDCLAGAELQHGHHAAADQLATRADALRSAAQ